MIQQEDQDLKHLARLVGYEENPTSEASQQLQKNLAQTIDEIVTKQPLWSNPWSKLILVAVGTGSVALFMALFFGSIMSGGRKINPDGKSPSPTVTPPSVQPNRTDNAALQTKLALQAQAQDFKAASELKKTEPEINKSDTKPVAIAPKIPAQTPGLPTPLPRLASSKPVVPPDPKTIVREVVRRVPVPISASTHTPRISISRPTNVTPPLTQSPRPVTNVTPSLTPISRLANVTPSLTQSPRPVTNVTPPRTQASPPPPTRTPATTKPTPTKTDPMEQLIAISKLGSYGQSELHSNSDRQKTTEANPPVNDKPSVASTEMTVAGVPQALLVDRTKTTSPDLEKHPIDRGTYLAEETYILQERSFNQEERNLQVGQYTEGSLLTPIVSSELSNATTANPNQERFVIKLNQPLFDNSRQPLLPSGALVIFVVAGVNPNGLVNCNAIAVVVDGKEYQLPPGAISLRGDDGKPLIASKWGDPGSAIARMDATTAAISAVGKVGQVMNQPRREQQQDFDDIYGNRRSTTIERGEPNLLGAVLEGGLNPLQQQIQQRNQQAVQEMQNRPTLWYVPEGKKVQVFVNRSFDM